MLIQASLCSGAGCGPVKMLIINSAKVQSHGDDRRQLRKKSLRLWAERGGQEGDGHIRGVEVAGGRGEGRRTVVTWSGF